MDTFLIHQKIWNHLSKCVFENHIELSSRTLQERTYHKCRKLFLDAPSQIVIRAIHDVISTFKSIKSNHELDSLKSFPIKNSLSIRLDKRLYTIKGNSIKLTTNGPKVLCVFDPYVKFQELLLKHPICDPLIFVRDNEVWMSVTFDDSTTPLIDNHCIGVDLGIKRTAVTSEGVFIIDKSYLKQKRRIRYLKRRLNSKKKESIHNGRNGNSSRKHLKKIRNHERNLSKNYAHHVVNKILETKANAIVIEDLSGIKDQNKGKRFNNKRSQIPFFTLRQILTYKAQTLGKRVETVNPAFTSQNDYRGFENGKRVGCRYYASDGKVFDADLQASINIGNRWGHKNKLPVSFVEPIDGLYRLNGQAVCQPANRLAPLALQVRPVLAVGQLT